MFVRTELSMLQITSVKNPRIKSVVDLGTAKERRRRQQFTVEGAREIKRALDCGYKIVEVYICSDVLSADAKALEHQFIAAHTVEVSKPVFEKIAMRSDKDGLVAVFAARRYVFDDVKLSKNPLIIAVQGIEKPGNLGALIRSADATGVDCVVVLDDEADMYHQHVIRNSLGAVFHIPVVSMSSTEFRSAMQALRVATYAAALTDSARSYIDFDYKGATAFVLGEEAKGLTDDWLTADQNVVKLPMLGIADSLNVSAAGAVLLYEALRQRR